ncbi:MAG: hypothetical protein Kow00107_06540 [Planctomycetota bacterium]
MPESRRVGDDYFGGIIEVAEEGACCFIRVRGLGSLSVGAPLRLYLEEAKQRGFTEFIFDLNECQGMDSSFMGLIAALSLDMQDTPAGFVLLVGLSDYNRSLLRQLGLHDFVDEGHADIPSKAHWTKLDPSSATALDRARLAYEAHGKLIEIRPENRNRFYEFLKRLGHDLLPFLKHDKDSDSKD